jgi:hypothetical protein
MACEKDLLLWYYDLPYETHPFLKDKETILKEVPEATFNKIDGAHFFVDLHYQDLDYKIIDDLEADSIFIIEDGNPIKEHERGSKTQSWAWSKRVKEIRRQKRKYAIDRYRKVYRNLYYELAQVAKMVLDSDNTSEKEKFNARRTLRNSNRFVLLALRNTLYYEL